MNWVSGSPFIRIFCALALPFLFSTSFVFPFTRIRAFEFKHSNTTHKFPSLSSWPSLHFSIFAPTVQSYFFSFSVVLWWLLDFLTVTLAILPCRSFVFSFVPLIYPYLVFPHLKSFLHPPVTAIFLF